MTCLETINSKPHDNFPDITTANLYTILTDTFEVSSSEITTIKDILNMYSYIINGLPGSYAFFINTLPKAWHKYEFIVPPTGDLVESAIVIALKLSMGISITAKASKTKHTDISKERSEFIANILNLKFSEDDSVVKFSRLKRYEDVFKLTPIQLATPMFRDKFVNKEFNIYTEMFTTKAINYVYIDFSSSMRGHVNILKTLYDSVVFDDYALELHMYSVTESVLHLMGIVKNKEELYDMLFINTGYYSGLIDYTRVIQHSNTHPYQSTFLTDGDDFEIAAFKRNTAKFNLISIHDEEVIKT